MLVENADAMCEIPFGLCMVIYAYESQLRFRHGRSIWVLAFSELNIISWISTFNRNPRSSISMKEIGTKEYIQ